MTSGRASRTAGSSVSGRARSPAGCERRDIGITSCPAAATAAATADPMYPVEPMMSTRTIESVPVRHTSPMIRRAELPDRDELLQLIREFYAVDRHEFDVERVARGLDPLLADDTHGQVWLINKSGYAVVTWGWSLESGGREALLDEIYVRDRGRGVGRELLTHAMAAAAKAGAIRMFLETEAHNERVRAFYASLGFATEDSTWMSADL